MASKWTILAPIALSQSCRADVEYARSVATALGSELHLLQVPDGEYRHAGVCAATAARIADRADAIDAALVLMIARRYGRWNRFWRSSVTEQVMQLSARPVWIVPANACDANFRFRSRRFLCAVGLDYPDGRLLRHAHEVATIAAADLALLHVVPEPSEALLYDAVERSSRPLSKSRAAKNLARVARNVPLLGTASVVVGDACECIGSTARDHSADLVFASRPHGGLQAVYGGDLEHIVRRLNRPLVTVPAGVVRTDADRVPAAERRTLQAAAACAETPSLQWLHQNAQ